MNTDTRVYLKKRFKDYYWKHGVTAPSEVHRREFGVGTLDDKIKFRHKSFESERELNQYLRTEAPFYISYSTAYYEFPAQPMAEKKWLGADLVFDLDKPMPLLSDERLRDVKAEAAALVGFLRADFGLPEKAISVNFSGGKGYHIHAVSDDLRCLGSEARREIVDYITGTGLDIGYFIREADGPRGFTFKRKGVQATSGARVGPRRGSVGWAGRVFAIAEELLKMPADSLQEIEGVGPVKAKKIADGRERNLKLLSEGKWDALFDQLGVNIQRQIYSKAVAVTDDDKQVTGDVSRLIRLPDTIHGGSGLLAKRVADLGKFDPLVDAVAFGGEAARVRLSEDVGVFQLAGGQWGPYAAGQVVDACDAAAMYLMLKGKGELAP
jgi:DNA primase small subunit